MGKKARTHARARAAAEARQRERTPREKIPVEYRQMEVLAETLEAYSVHPRPVFCAVCDGEIRVPEVAGVDPATGRAAHRSCAKKPQRAFDLLRGLALPAARRFL